VFAQQSLQPIQSKENKVKYTSSIASIKYFLLACRTRFLSGRSQRDRRTEITWLYRPV